jgi:hypothetical protein
MNAWFRRLLLVLTVGGGFLGLALTLQLFATADKAIVYLTLLAFVGLYGYGIFVGLKLSEGFNPIAHLRFYFALQVPFISSPVIAYRFCSGLQATVAIIYRGGEIVAEGLHLESGLRWDCRLGSEWKFAILSSEPWGCGVNLVALILMFLLYSRWAGVPGERASPT